MVDIEYNPHKCKAIIFNNKKKELKQCTSNCELYFCGKHKNDSRINILNYKEIINKFPEIIKPDITLNINSSIFSIYYTLLQKYNLDYNLQEPIILKHKFLEFISSKFVNIYKKIQLKYRLKRNIKRMILQGPCIIDNNKYLLNNEQDFYTLENIKDIPEQYFFSFLDTNGFYYGFDIRSLKQLIDKNNTNNKNNKKELKDIINPYSTLNINKNVVSRILKFINYLENLGHKLVILNDVQLTPEQKKREDVMKIFSIIDQFGYQTDIEWILSMNINELKKLYRIMEDIWNYRSDLSYTARLEIIPTENVIPLFYLSVEYVYRMNNYNQILDIILNVFERLLTESNNLATRTLGALYILTGLATISYDVANAYPDFVQNDPYYDTFD
jgi:hypothetical protein